MARTAASPRPSRTWGNWTASDLGAVVLTSISFRSRGGTSNVAREVPAARRQDTPRAPPVRQDTPRALRFPVLEVIPPCPVRQEVPACEDRLLPGAAPRCRARVLARPLLQRSAQARSLRLREPWDEDSALSSPSPTRLRQRSPSKSRSAPTGLATLHERDRCYLFLDT